MDWQPIETAPKDLTEVLVFCPRVGVTTAQFEPYATPPHWNYDVWDFDVRVLTMCEPTHWLPLPDPPAAVAQAA